ncbi:MAG: quinoprotein amine dehydrogenase, beta chain-like protein [Deltaproteobacteria bacterium]|nr:quinoprotein amine dehydrogenase, beta chain-like protein [Deltaproteobacteria bacterium]
MNRNVNKNYGFKFFIAIVIICVLSAGLVLGHLLTSFAANNNNIPLPAPHNLSKKFLEQVPVKITEENIEEYARKLPTGRLISPIGLLGATEDFPTSVKIYKQYVVVLSNPAKKIQKITLYNRKNLKPVAILEAFEGEPNLPYLGQVVQYAERPSINKIGGHVTSLIYASSIARVPNSKVPTTVIRNQSFFQGLAVSKNGTIYAAGGVTGNVLAVKYIKGRLKAVRSYRLKWQSFPKNQYPYEYQGHQNIKPYLFYPDYVALSNNQKYIYATGLLSNSIAEINLKTGAVKYANAGPYPFAVSLADNEKRLIVSDWGGDEVRIFNPSLKYLGKVSFDKNPMPSSGMHPTQVASVPGSSLALVAASNNDSIFAVDTANLKIVKVIHISPYKHAPYGSYPDGITVSGKYFFAADAGNNDVEVFNLSNYKPVGLIPTAWYPASLTATQKSIFIADAKGLGAGPNLEYQWIGSFMHGAVQKVKINYFLKNKSYLTHLSLKDDGFTYKQRTARKEKEAAMVKFLRKRIKHIVFILRENKTFDEDLGDYKHAGKWADPHLDLYNQKELPNLYKLANKYALFVNFYADGEVTAQGHEWTTGASDSDYVQRVWPENYSGRGLRYPQGRTLLKPAMPDKEDTFLNPAYIGNRLMKKLNVHLTNIWISYPYKLYLFNDMSAHHITFSDFGEFVAHTRINGINRQMEAHIVSEYPGWNRDILDTTRSKIFINWAKKRIKENRFPDFVYIWLPDDHTAGLAPCYYTPQYYVANNDEATGKILSFLSRSKIWKNTLVFLTEDDAQSGADHISAHRTFALMMGPYVKKGALVRQRYSQVSIVKTIEALFNLPPMSQWDANAKVIINGYTKKPDFKPYNYLNIRVKKGLNPGNCSNIQKLRLKLGAKLPEKYVPLNLDKTKITIKIKRKNLYTPTTLLRVSGFQQFTQEWIGVKGVKSYRKVLSYIRTLAEKRKAPVEHFMELGR